MEKEKLIEKHAKGQKNFFIRKPDMVNPDGTPRKRIFPVKYIGMLKKEIIDGVDEALVRHKNRGEREKVLVSQIFSNRESAKLGYEIDEQKDRL
jgi:hypothetical protein